MAWVGISAGQPKRLYPGADLTVNAISVAWLSMIGLFIKHILSVKFEMIGQS